MVHSELSVYKGLPKKDKTLETTEHNLVSPSSYIEIVSYSFKSFYFFALLFFRTQKKTDFKIENHFKFQKVRVKDFHVVIKFLTFVDNLVKIC